jgi:hypothetical protein
MLVARSSGRPSTHNGSTGSAARRSTSTNATSSTSPAPNTPNEVGEIHAHALPPSSTPSSSRVRDAVSSAAPA